MKRALLFLLLFSLSVTAISSSEARDKISKCIKDSNPDLPQSLKPLGVGSDYYWVFSYPISSQKKIVAAVNDGLGERVTNQEELRQIASTVFDQGLAEEIKNRGYSAALLQTTISQSAQQTTRLLANLDVFREQTEKKYQQLNFNDLHDTLTILSNRANDLDAVLRDSNGYQQSFETDY